MSWILHKKNRVLSWQLSNHQEEVETECKMKLTENQLDQIEHLLQQSMNGIHILFEHKQIAEILKKPTATDDPLKGPNMEKVDKLFNELAKRENLSSKRLFLERLDTESFEMIVRAYFQIVENTLKASSEYKH